MRTMTTIALLNDTFDKYEAARDGIDLPLENAFERGSHTLKLIIYQRYWFALAKIAYPNRLFKRPERLEERKEANVANTASSTHTS